MKSLATSGPAAAALALAAAVLASSARAGAFDPVAVPETIGWRLEPESPSLATEPLRSLSLVPRVRSEAEWSPLYAGRDGARIESAHRTLELRTSPRGPWRLGLELDTRLATVRGGDHAPWLGAERVRSTRAVLGAAWNTDRIALAGAALADHDRLGLAAEGRATLGGRAQAWWSWSRAPQAGRVAVRWDEVDVFASGRWVDQRVAWRLAAPLGGVAMTLGQEALDRRPSGRFADDARDGFEPDLAWRASTLDGATDARGARWNLGLRYGEGRERVRLWRGDAPYATVAGRVFNALLSAGWEPHRAPIALRVWGGQWSGSARGAVALWPFDPVAALAGTRRVAVSNGSLSHAGVSFDRTPRRGSGVDYGIALCRIVPRARYESWQAALLGQGRDDESESDASLRAAWLAGARLAGTLEGLGLRARLELVQWAPIRIEREPAERGSDPGGGSGEDGGDSPGHHGSDRGGTVVRVSIQSLR
jgi:hypothetical protein